MTRSAPPPASELIKKRTRGLALLCVSALATDRVLGSRPELERVDGIGGLGVVVLRGSRSDDEEAVRRPQEFAPVPLADPATGSRRPTFSRTDLAERLNFSKIDAS